MKKLLLFIAFAIFGLGLNAQNVGDLTIIYYDGYSLTFKITSVEPAECKVYDFSGTPVDVTIPSTVEIIGTEFNVTSIGSGAFEYCSSLTSIEIPNSVTSIGYMAFSGCSSLTSIEIPNSVTSIGEGAFYYCESLTSIEIPNSVTSIGDDTFYRCSSLTSVTFGENSQLTSIGLYAFGGCSSLTSIEIPNSVTSIESYAFVGCSSLTSIVVAEGNTVYDSRENCNAIIKTSSNKLIAGCQNTVIPNSVTSIGDYAFYGSSSLTSIEIPNSVTSIGDEAFYECSSLTSITFGDNPQLTSIEGFAFSYCSSLKSIEIPNSVTSIGESAFSDCSSLTSVTFGENSQLTSIGLYAFEGCSSLTSIEIPNSVTSIGSSAFYRCSSLTSIEIPNSVTSIGDYAFYRCSSLTSIEIPNSVTSIGVFAFSYCSSLGVIKCYAEDVPETGYNVFYDCPSDMIIYVPEVSLEDYKATFPWNEFTIVPLVAVGPAKVSLDVVAMPYEVTITATPNEYAVEFHIGVLPKAFFDAEGLEKVIQMVRDDVYGYPEYEQMSATWQGLVPGGEYVALCSAKNANDEWGETVVVHFTAPFGDVTPENLVANVLSTSSIKLTWDKVTNAKTYRIYQDGQVIVNSTADTEWLVTGLDKNTKYCFRVTACNGDVESPYSEELCTSIAELENPTELLPPTNLRATVEQDVEGYNYKYRVTMMWDAVEGVVDYYNVYVNTEYATDFYLGLSNGTQYIVGSNSEGTIEFYVKSVLDGEESEASEKCTVIIEDNATELLPPTNLRATVEQDVEGYNYKYRVTMMWDAVEGVVDYYNVYVNTEYVTDFYLGLSNGTQYIIGSNSEGTIEFYVKSVLDGEESEASEKCTVIIKDNADEPLPEQPNQSLLFSYEGNIIEPTTINITRELNSSMEIQFDLEVTNNTDNPVNIVCEIEDNSGIGSNYVCWGSCYAPGMYNVVNTLDAFSTSMFNGHCMFVDENWNELPKGTIIPMKYTFYDENNPSLKYTFNVNFKYDTPQQQYRNVLIEEFTGRNCGWCPLGQKTVNNIIKKNPERVYTVNIHSASVGSLSPSTYPNLNTLKGADIARAYNVEGIPLALINRSTDKPVGLYTTADKWGPMSNEQMQEQAECNIAGRVEINKETRLAKITVEVYYTANSVEENNYLTVVMLQDSIFGLQSGAEQYNPSQIVDGQYCHMHVLRDVITSTWGDAVSPTIAGSHIVKTYTYEIPEIIGDPNGVEVDLDNIYFLAFVTEKQLGTATCPVLNVDKLKNVTDGETPELPHYWTPDPSLYANNMTVIATIAIDGEEQYNTDLELGAFCNGELRGAERLQETAGNYECFLMIYGDSGDNITFKLYDHASGNILDLKTNQSLTFEANATIGDVFDPYVINFTNTVVHNQALKSGWNWYSTYVVNEGADGLANLENAVGTNGIQIKNQSKFVNQAGGSWYGTMTSTAVEDMYMIQLSSATNVALEGYEVNPADYPITLGTNWKWISYPLATEMSVAEAFASANPSNGDYIKSQKGFAQYYEGLGWSGTLKTMTPGMGYMYQNKSGYAKTLVYPTPNNKSASVSVSESESINHWTADYSKYPMNMTMIAVVEGAESAYEVAAFADGECRGSARPIYVEALDSYIMFMTISGEDNEALTFKYYDVETGETYAIVDEFTFSVNATVGDVMNPYVMTRGTMGIDDLSSSINIYPNPVDNELFLATELRVEEIAIYDIYGRKTMSQQVNETTSQQVVEVADLEAGIYFVNIKTENGNVVKRFVKN